jgi:hypothetical protein
VYTEIGELFTIMGDFGHDPDLPTCPSVIVTIGHTTRYIVEQSDTVSLCECENNALHLLSRSLLRKN